MILDERYENLNFKKSKNILFRYLDRYEYFVEMNTKFHTKYTNDYKKKFIFDLKMFYMLSDVLFIYMCSYAVIKDFSIVKTWASPIYIIFFIVWLMYQFIHIKSYTLGTKDNLKLVKGVYDYNEYVRYHEISLPKDTLPEWITDTNIIYSKESFDTLITKLTTEKKYVDFLNKYKRLAFKTNTIIDNNKKILTSWLKKDRENLEIVGEIPITLFDYKTFWKEQGFDEKEIEEMYKDKINELTKKQ